MNDNIPAPVSDEAVLTRTGKAWSDWFAILDDAGAVHWPHKEMAQYLQEKHALDGWWAQTITVGYEQARGLRHKHQAPDGYKISVGRTIGAPMERLYEAWRDESQRQRWLPETGMHVRKATPSKSMRITWIDGVTSLSVNFYAKGEVKSQVVVEHSKLATAEVAAQQKIYWGEVLDRLRTRLESET